MRAYIGKLRATVELERTRREEQVRSTAQSARERLTPLEDRLARLLSTIPDRVRAEGLSLPILQTALRGRWRGNAHPGELGRAMRKLGFERRRNWRGGDGFRALWYPKGNQ